MSIKFLKDFSDKNILFQEDAIITESDNIRIEQLNENDIMVIVHGLRYDFKIKDIIII